MKTSIHFPTLFSQGRIGPLMVPNRIVMAPMATNFASATGEVTDWMIHYYSKRATGGVGFIIVENANVDYPNGISGTTQLRVDKDRFIPGLFRLSQAIHSGGALCALQINHAGGVAKSGEEGVRPVAPSRGPDGLYHVSPKRLNRSGIEQIVTSFAQAARRVKIAGFDAVEIHGAHAYLIAQFLSPLTNRRQNHYGGEIEGRTLFARQILTEARKEVGPDFPIIFRLDVSEWIEGGIDLEESIRIAEILKDIGVDAFDLSMGTHYQLGSSMCVLLEPMSYPQGWRLEFVGRMRNSLQVPVIAVGPFREPQFAEDALKEGKVDFVALGRALIADPDWPAKAFDGREKEINRCISCNEGCVRSKLFEGRPVNCTVNPEVGWEKNSFPVYDRKSLRIMVVGGGPAGCSAAIYARQRGHQVTLLERTSELGGNCLLGSKLPYKEKLAWFVEYQRRRIEDLKVDIRLGETLSSEILKEIEPQLLIFAIGAEPFIPEEIEIEGTNPIYVEDLLRKGCPWSNVHIAVIGGGALGCEFALAIAKEESEITILEAMARAAGDIEPISRFDLLDRIGKEPHIRLLTHARVVRVEGTNVHYETELGKRETLKVDHIVWATGYRPRKISRLSSDVLKGIDVKRIGDCLTPRNVFHAVRDGFWLGTRT